MAKAFKKKREQRYMMLEKGKKEDEGGRVESVRRVFFLFDLTQGTRQSRPTSGGFLFFPLSLGVVW